MKHRPIALFAGILTVAAASLFPADSVGDDKDAKALQVTLKLPKDAVPAASAEQLLDLFAQFRTGGWKPQVNEEKARGPSADVYAKMAPTVVIVRTGDGYGTGVIIDPAGWIVTNHHVIAGGERDRATGAIKAKVYRGKLEAGAMKLIEEPMTALVYKSSPEKDLALLKITQLPAGVKELPAAELAKESPRPGSECVAIGHPADALLWTVRSGEISGAGNWPKDKSDFVAVLLGAGASDREMVTKQLALVPQRKMLLTNVGVNSGDSGGPLFDPQGKLIAVTFAMPGDSYRGTAAFAYHVHLDEVRPFLADRPTKPQQMPAPSPWPAGFRVSYADLDDDGIPETLVFGKKEGEGITGVLVDLKQITPRNFRVADIQDPERRKAFKFQFALHTQPPRAFYATGKDGEIDLILTPKSDGSGLESALRRTGDTWAPDDVSKYRSPFDPSLFPEKDMRDRFIKVVSRLRR